MDDHSQFSGSIECISWLASLIVPQHSLLKADSCCVCVDIIQVECFSIVGEEVVGEFSVLSPVLDSAKVKGVKVDGCKFA